MSASAPVVVELLFAGYLPAVTGLASESRLGWKGEGAAEGSDFASSRVQLGEGSIWDHRTDTLYWIDILGKALHCWVESRPGQPVRHHRRFPLPSMPGTVVLTAQVDVQLVACQDGLYLVNSVTGEAVPTGIVADGDVANHRCNDGKVDPSGRLVVGTMNLDEGEAGREKGSLYRLDASGRLQRLATGISIANGLAWSADGRRFFHTDTPTGLIREFPYGDAAQDGGIGGGYSAGKVAIRVPDGWGFPDGCAIDEDDHLWVASWGGGRVGRFSTQTGQLMSEFTVAAGLVSRISSVAFGGPTLSDLYVTTAAPQPEFDYGVEPLAGSLFVARNLPTRGRPQKPFVGLTPARP